MFKGPVGVVAREVRSNKSISCCAKAKCSEQAGGLRRKPEVATYDLQCPFISLQIINQEAYWSPQFRKKKGKFQDMIGWCKYYCWGRGMQWKNGWKLRISMISMTPKSSSSSSWGMVPPLDLAQSTHGLRRGVLKVDGLEGDTGYEKDTIKVIKVILPVCIFHFDPISGFWEPSSSFS